MVQLTEKQKNELKDMLLEYLNGDEIESSGITHILNRFFPAESRVYTKDSFGKQDYKILIATGAGNTIQGGADIWVNSFLQEIWTTLPDQKNWRLLIDSK